MLIFKIIVSIAIPLVPSVAALIAWKKTGELEMAAIAAAFGAAITLLLSMIYIMIWF